MISTSLGCLFNETQDELGPAPVIFISETYPKEGDKLIFRCEGSFVDGSIETYQWKIFNDEDEVIFTNDSIDFYFTFKEAGSYRAELVVIDENGRTGNATQSIVISSKLTSKEFTFDIYPGTFTFEINETFDNGDFRFNYTGYMINGIWNPEIRITHIIMNKTLGIFWNFTKGSMNAGWGFRSTIIVLTSDYVMVEIEDIDHTNFFGYGIFYQLKNNSTFGFQCGHTIKWIAYFQENDTAELEIIKDDLSSIMYVERVKNTVVGTITIRVKSKDIIMFFPQ